MDTSNYPTIGERPKRSRATRACAPCNVRRVRCNVTEMQPCFNCTTSKATCEVFPSKRGRYKRTRSKNSVENPTNGAATSGLGTGGDHRNSTSQPPSTLSSSILDNGRDQQHSLSAGGSSGSPVSTAPSPLQSAGKDVFYGESCPLTCIIGKDKDPADVGSHFRVNKMRIELPDNIKSHAAKLANVSTDPYETSKYNYLVREGAFSFPPSESLLLGLEAFFTWFHPAFPVIDKIEMAQQYHSGIISPLLLHAALFIASVYCDQETILAMGFPDRVQAKAQFYYRAQLLFNADWESNTTTVLQSLFLLSFWRAGPSTVKNVRYWLGAAIGLAQDNGFHRATKISTKQPMEAKMRRRIWWAIYTRERQSSAALGLPCRIRDDDCDVEMLSEDDLLQESEAGSLRSFMGPTKFEHAFYPIKMASLAIILGNIIYKRFAPRRKEVAETDFDEIAAALEKWKTDLPSSAEMKEGNPDPLSHFSQLLHVSYNHLLILLHRNALVKPRIGKIEEEAQKAVQAANRITRIIEDMLSLETIQFGQMHCITGFFAAMCVQTHEFQLSNGTAKRLAESRAKLCLLGLKEIQKYWKINNLILELFLKYVDEAVIRKLCEEDPSTDQQSQAQSQAQSEPPSTQTADFQLPSQVNEPQTSYGAMEYSRPSTQHQEINMRSGLTDYILNAGPLGSASNEDCLPPVTGANTFGDDIFGFLNTNDMAANNTMWVEDFELLQRRL